MVRTKNSQKIEVDGMLKALIGGSVHGVVIGSAAITLLIFIDGNFIEVSSMGEVYFTYENRRNIDVFDLKISDFSEIIGSKVENITLMEMECTLQFSNPSLDLIFRNGYDGSLSINNVYYERGDSSII